MSDASDRVGVLPFIGIVYAVRRYDSLEFRYVGITTKSVDVRRRQHLKLSRAGRKSPFYDWLRKHDGESEEVYFQPMELVMGDDLEALGAAEERWIAVLREEGHPLLNLSDGGLGPRGYVWTAEQRAAASERSHGRKRPDIRSGPEHPMWGTHRSEELKAKWSAERKGMNSGAKNPNFGKFGAQHPSYGHRMSEEAKARLSEMRRGENNPNFGKTASAETRAKMSAVRKGRPQPSSRRSAHTRHHTNKSMFSETCAYCIEDQHNAQGGMRNQE
ncbi:NUMOD3 domain-containing DNA-binding protein [Microbacterium sp. ZW T5_45]|uniref:NUMOD3 domain-containing DNA-binding protein n=1 Tax=Microbacterium sp. ZW T5_45 TaxID=3378080 RepID=UPI0038550C94